MLTLTRLISISRKPALLLFLASLASPSAFTHEIGQSYMFLRVYDQSMDGRLEVRSGDLDSALSIDANGDKTISNEELAESSGKILQYLKERIAIGDGEREYEIEYQPSGIEPIEIADYAVIPFKVLVNQALPDNIKMRYGLLFDVDSSHRGGLVIEHNPRAGIENNHGQFAYMFAANRQTAEVGLLQENRLVRFGRFVREGVWHIWIGIDHILFVVALLLPSVMTRKNRQWQPVSEFRSAFVRVLKVVTLFTVAHSITLTLAVLGLVQLPIRLVESVIALSVVLVAVNNIKPMFNDRIWWLIFGFGLFHGFGFASVLMDLGLTAKSRAMSLFGFNVGVELGQLAIIFAIVPVLYWLRNTRLYQPLILRAASAIIALIASWWFITRAFEFNIV